MRGLLVAVWLIMVVPAAWAAMTTITWETSESVEPENTYLRFLDHLRREITDPQVQFHGIPALQKSTSKKDSDNYVLVELKASDEKSIILTVDKSDLYIVGYSDFYIDTRKKKKIVEKCRYHLFKELDVERCETGDGIYKRCGLCDGKPKVGVIEKAINYKSSYSQIEKNTPGKKNRKETGLGFNKLNGLVEQVYGIDITGGTNIQIEAEFLLIAIQMVAEAARFSHIQRMIPASYYGELKPQDREICYEKNWAAASVLIKTTPEEEHDFPIELGCWKFSSIDDMRSDIAVLSSTWKFKTNTLEAQAEAQAEAQGTVDGSRHQVAGSVLISLLVVGIGICLTYRRVMK